MGELVRNWPWVMLLVATVFSTTFIALRQGSTLFYFKYIVGDDGTPILFGALLLLGINVVLGIVCYVLLRSGWKLKA